MLERLHDININSEFGNVTLEIPGDSSFTADLHTRFGHVQTDFDELNGNSGKNEFTEYGQVGTGGPKIHVDSRNGQIHLLKKG